MIHSKKNRHPLIIVLLEKKRADLGEEMRVFSRRVFPELAPATAYQYYTELVGKKLSFPEKHIASAAALLEVDERALFLA